MTQWSDSTPTSTVAIADQDVFIVGSPRSGTTWLQAVLSNHPSFVSPPETYLFQGLHGVLGGFVDLPDGIGPTTVLPEHVFAKWCGLLWAHIRSELLAARPGATRVLEKTPGHAEYMNLIRSAVPNPRFIHIVRNPADVVRSLLEASEDWGDDWAPDSVDIACTWWIRNVSAAIASSHGDDTLMVRYEDLRRDPDEWHRIMAFVGIDSTWDLPDPTASPGELGVRTQYRSSTNDFGPQRWVVTVGHSFHDRNPASRRDLTAFERRYVQWACGDLMTEVGYRSTHPTLSIPDRMRAQSIRAQRTARKVRQRLRR